MRRTTFGGSNVLTRQEFLRRIGTVGVVAAAVGGFTIFEGPIAEAARPTTQSTFTQKLGGPGAPSKIRGSVAVAKDDPRVAFRGGAT